MAVRANVTLHHPEVLAFWTGLAEGRLLLRWCRACECAHWYPRALCPYCSSHETEWRQASGKGTIYSFSIMRRVSKPFAIAYVKLAEGPTMITNIVESGFESIAIGKPVELKIGTLPGEDDPLPLFKLADSAC